MEKSKKITEEKPRSNPGLFLVAELNAVWHYLIFKIPI
nr:MAG TPA: hypothetical protein [Caudoviricetes sp.]